ncbi:MAG: protein kinase [Polyangiaceae bacterium]
MSLPPPGALVDDNFRLERVIGVGGMSHVVLAHDVSLDRPVALKFLGRNLVGDSVWRERFVHEAKHMARVRHPNVMGIHAFGVHEGWPYFVMDYIEGIPLSQWLEQHPRAPVEEIVALVRQIADGLEAIHAAGLVHHDVKPANVLVDGSRVVLMDLGISRLDSRLDAAHECAGTPQYMAPEQAIPARLDARGARRVDVYQLGVTTFELLTGRLPFGASFDVLEGEGGSRARQAAPPSAVRPGIGAQVDAAVLRAMARDPEQRWPSPAEFAVALELAVTADAGTAAARPALHVLLAEDDPLQREATRELLLAELPPGSRVHAAPDGVAALEAFDHDRFDVVVMDLHMPRMGGHDLARALASRPGPRPVMAALTAMGGSDDWHALRELGVDALVLKPFEAVDLATLIEARAAAKRDSARPRS